MFGSIPEYITTNLHCFNFLSFLNFCTSVFILKIGLATSQEVVFYALKINFKIFYFYVRIVINNYYICQTKQSNIYRDGKL